MMTIHKYGNTTTATIPLCLWDYEVQAKAATLVLLRLSAAASPGAALM